MKRDSKEPKVYTLPVCRSGLTEEEIFIDRLAEIMVKQALYGQCDGEKLPYD